MFAWFRVGRDQLGSLQAMWLNPWIRRGFAVEHEDHDQCMLLIQVYYFSIVGVGACIQDGGAKEPDEPHRLLNRENQSELSLLR